MIKNGNEITINLVSTSPTTEHNGVEVRLQGLFSAYKYLEGLMSVIFFPNIYINSGEGPSYISSTKMKNMIDSINNCKIKRYKNFSVASIKTEDKLLLGNVLYPLNTMSITDEKALKILSLVRNTGIVFNFNVGELLVTPNREAILYNTETVELITNRILAAMDEMYSEIDKTIPKDYTDIDEYSTFISNKFYVNFLDVDNVEWKMSIHSEDLMDNVHGINFRGKDLYKWKSILWDLNGMDIPGVRAFVSDTRVMYSYNLPYGVKCKLTLRNMDWRKYIVIPAKDKLPSSLKRYLLEKHRNTAIIEEISETQFKDIANKYYVQHTSLVGNKESRETQEDIKIMDFIVDCYYEKFKKMELKLDYKAYEKFIQEEKEERKKCRKNSVINTNPIIYFRVGYAWNKREFGSYERMIDYLKSLHTGIILIGMNDEYKTPQAITELKGFTLIKCRNNLRKYMQNKKHSFLVDLDWYLYKDPLIKRCKTALKYSHSSKIINREILNILNCILPKERMDTINDVIEVLKVALCHYDYISSVVQSTTDIDKDFDKKLKQYMIDQEKFESIYEDIKNMFGYIYNFKILDAIYAKYLLSEKVCRITGKAYLDMINSRFIKILCRK